MKKAHVGIEVIIKVIRGESACRIDDTALTATASSNPRTSQRALLVAAELARLIPEAVLHNVMPIFTFMGASDFQRDDAYSFGVVEKARSTKSALTSDCTKYRTGHDAQFERAVRRPTCAVQGGGGVPGYLCGYGWAIAETSDTSVSLLHQRLFPADGHRFFVHLVKSLGPADFLPPMVMLLVDRATTKGGRNGALIQAMELVLGVTGAFELSARVDVRYKGWGGNQLMCRLCGKLWRNRVA